MNSGPRAARGVDAWMTTTDRCAKVPERIVDNCKAVVQERERVPPQFAPMDLHFTTIRPVHVDPYLKFLAPRRRVVRGLSRQESDFVSLTVFERVSKRTYAHLVEMWIQDEQAPVRPMTAFSNATNLIALPPLHSLCRQRTSLSIGNCDASLLPIIPTPVLVMDGHRSRGCAIATDSDWRGCSFGIVLGLVGFSMNGDRVRRRSGVVSFTRSPSGERGSGGPHPFESSHDKLWMA